MQGLMKYHDNSPPSSPPQQAGPSRAPANDHVSVLRTSSSKDSQEKGKMKANDSDEQAVYQPDHQTNSGRTLDTPTGSAGPSRPRSSSPSARQDAADAFDGLSEEEIFRLVTRPDPIEGVEDWGIPAEVDPDQAPDALKAKVEHFLRLKYERGQHINSTLLSSTSFANPHIYAKLVEFVDINETATAFPSGGWMTRRSIEDLIPDHGPKALAATQKARQDAVKRSQEVGKRSNIQFAPGRRRDGDSRESTSFGTSGSAKKRSREDEYRDRGDRYARDKKYEYDRRDRERDRERRDRR